MHKAVISVLAWRNIWRNRRRTLLTLLAVAFSSAVLVFFMSLQLSSYDTSINASVSIFQGHLQVQPTGYFKKPKMYHFIREPRALIKNLAELKGITAVAPRAYAYVLVSSARRTVGAQVAGVDPELEKNVSTIPGLVREGEYLSADDLYQAVIGQDLAHNLGVSTGEQITVLGQGQDGSMAAAAFQVVGIFQSGSRDLDRALIEVPLKIFQEVFYLGDAAHTIVIKASSRHRLAELKKNISARLKNKKLSVYSWEELMPGLKQAIELDMASGWLFYISLILIVVFSVFNTFLMSILERTREFGVMLSLGMKPASIIKMVILENVFLSLLGVFSGIVIGSLVVIYYGIHGFYIPGAEEIMKLWNLPTAVKTRLSLRGTLSGPAVIIAANFVVAFIPALKLLRLQPVEAMRAV
ncbi:MAG: ABC transporter permease [Candidatus Dadabacteria bacterium]|nr:MAG: ABC transporter permease [Candidatus Dadabacteria bacterium]